MQNWEKALYKFLRKYKNDPYFEGAVLCGSYACGNQNEFSDIDVHILINDEQNWRERGVVEVDGFLVEYFINPSKQIRKEFKEDYNNGGNASASMFGYGKILEDKNDNIKKLQKEALKFLNKAPRKWQKKDLSLDLYRVWTFKDELNSLAAEKRVFNLVYYDLAKSLLSLYCKAKGIPQISSTKVEKILADTDFAKKYNVQKLPDKQFSKLFLAVLKEINLVKIQKLYDLVIKEVGGFDITKFKMRSKL